MDDIMDLLYAPEEAPIDDLLFAPDEAPKPKGGRRKKGEPILVGPDKIPMHLYKKKGKGAHKKLSVHAQAKLEGRKGFNRFDLIERQCLVTKEPKHRCRLHVNSVLAILLSELELGHDVILPGIGRFMFEKVTARIYRWPVDGERYTKPEHKRLIFAANANINLALRRNTRVVRPEDRLNPQEIPVQILRNTSISLRY